MTDVFHLYLNGRRILCRRQSGFPWRRTIVELPQREWNALDASSLEFPTPVIGKRLRAPLHVYVGSALCKFMVVDVPAGAADSREQCLIAEARMRQHSGLNADEWTCTTYVGKRQAQAVVCAVRADLIARIRFLAAMHGLKLVSLQPYATTLWNVVCGQPNDGAAPQAGLLAVEDDAFTLFLANSGAVASLNALMHNCESDLVERELLRVGLSAGVEMRAAVRLAVSKEFERAATFDRSRLIVRKGHRSAMLERDFRDLLLGTAAKT